MLTVWDPSTKFCVKRIDCTVCLERRWDARGFSKCFFEDLSINKGHVVGLGDRKCRGFSIHHSDRVKLLSHIFFLISGSLETYFPHVNSDNQYLFVAKPGLHFSQNTFICITPFIHCLISSIYCQIQKW